MTSQNRMNAGAEYVVYRLVATLQDADGIHPESLITCLGALAGYACRASVRSHARGDEVNQPLAGNPLSVWALLGRTVQKLGQPLPDVDDIFRHVTQTLDTSAFGVLRVGEAHRPRHSASVYVRQLWPQILPIAQRFCQRRAQLPVLFGIALQRAIEMTQHRLSPSLAASIAMESAVAMSKLVLLGAPTDASTASPPPSQQPISMRPAAGAASAPARAARAARGITRETAGDRRFFDAIGAFDAIKASWPQIAAPSFLSPQARSLAMVASLAIIAFAGVMLSVDGPEGSEVALAQSQQGQRSQPEQSRGQTRDFENTGGAFEETFQGTEPVQLAQAAQTQALSPSQDEPPLTDELEGPPPPPEQPFNEGIITEEWQSPLPSSYEAVGERPPGTIEL